MTFVAKPKQVASAVESIARFFYKNNEAPLLIGDGDLRAALAVLGVALPTRKALMGKALDDELAAVRRETEAALSNARFLTITTDGWKRKFAEHGVPLINVMVLLPDGGSKFIKIVTAAGVRKTMAWVFKLHKDLVSEVGGLWRVGGIVVVHVYPLIMLPLILSILI